jgi:hypothetical protein
MKLDGDSITRHSPCHAQHGCIRAFEDDTCGDEGQCTIARAIMAAVEEEREACATLIETFPHTIPNPDHIVERYGMFVRQTGRDDFSEAIRNRQSKDGYDRQWEATRIGFSVGHIESGAEARLAALSMR